MRKTIHFIESNYSEILNKGWKSNLLAMTCEIEKLPADNS